MKPRHPPRVIGEAEVGSIVRTDEGLLRVMGFLREWPFVRRVDPATLETTSEAFTVAGDLEVLQVLRDQTYYRTHPRAGGGEVDPLKGK